MRAYVYKKYGPPEVLQLEEVPKPVPNDNEVLIKVRATTVNRTDNATIKGKPSFMRLVTGLFTPKQPIPGSEFSGDIESIGKEIKSFKDGDKVFGFDDSGAGSHAEYLTISEIKIVTMPDNLSYEQAAACFEGAHYAYNFIKKVPLESGQKVLVNGASGAIGSAAVQLLKHFDANITAICGTQNVELVQGLGADRIIDYKKEDFTQLSETFDYVFDTVGKSSFFKCKHLLKPGGVYISSDLGFLWQNMFLPLITPVFKPLLNSKKTIAPIPLNLKKTLVLVKQLIEDRKFQPIIDREYSFKNLVDAYKYVEKGHKTGNVVIKM